jgi:hypothetical protein
VQLCASHKHEPHVNFRKYQSYLPKYTVEGAAFGAVIREPAALSEAKLFADVSAAAG